MGFDGEDGSYKDGICEVYKKCLGGVDGGLEGFEGELGAFYEENQRGLMQIYLGVRFLEEFKGVLGGRPSEGIYGDF